MSTIKITPKNLKGTSTTGKTENLKGTSTTGKTENLVKSIKKKAKLDSTPTPEVVATAENASQNIAAKTVKPVKYIYPVECVTSDEKKAFRTKIRSHYRTLIKEINKVKDEKELSEKANEALKDFMVTTCTKGIGTKIGL